MIFILRNLCVFLSDEELGHRFAELTTSFGPADAHADASRSGIHTGGEECAMPAWLHSEWRLLHAYVPACSGPARASLSGKRDFKTRDEGTETASLIQFLLCRDRALARDPRQLGAN
jgi:hypothetical protein